MASVEVIDIESSDEDEDIKPSLQHIKLEQVESKELQDHSFMINSLLARCVNYHNKLAQYEPFMDSSQRSKWLDHLDEVRQMFALNQPPVSNRLDENNQLELADDRAAWAPRPRRTYRRKTYRRKTYKRSRTTSRAKVNIDSNSSSTSSAFQRAKQTATAMHNRMIKARTLYKNSIKSDKKTSVRVKTERA